MLYATDLSGMHGQGGMRAVVEEDGRNRGERSFFTPGWDIRKIQLTPLQENLCRLLVIGLDNKEVAEELKLSIYSVKQILLRLYRKFGIIDGCKRVKLAIYFHRRERWICMVSGNLPKKSS